MDLITNGEEKKTLKAKCVQNEIINSNQKTLLCYPCNKNPCFIKLKQVLNCKVHNLGKPASRFFFGRLLNAGIYYTKAILLILSKSLNIKVFHFLSSMQYSKSLHIRTYQK